MLRIHFTGEDLAKTRIISRPDPLWETVLSWHMLRQRSTDPLLLPWKRQVLAGLKPGSPARAEVAPLLAVNPPLGYFPDLLTPAEAEQGLQAGVEAVLALPKPRLHREIGKLSEVHGGLDADTIDLAEGRTPALDRLGQALRGFHSHAIVPIADRIQVAFDADRAMRAQTFLKGGIVAVLTGLHRQAEFRDNVLEISDSLTDKEIHLNGRGLRLVPSYFKETQSRPMTLADPSLPQVLVYPVDRSAGLVASAAREPLAALLGRTRAALLELTEAGGSTSQLARRLEISPAAASQHLTIMREAGLIISVREANAMRHLTTPLGRAILSGRGAQRDGLGGAQ
ncbi:transcriptional regulator [Rhizocola hellebori]|uniref:Transcriptional regulator n=1 Tax=Rhizocola hellebori TaxID=1392758 RepID=A0A8J3VIQ6_9ACTN|nr:winged helix-turn-helix domain-containing protein [Rhizocola hellebori]GIH08649.1 transcriptional regulator [Rhizocola hellebori]